MVLATAFTNIGEVGVAFLHGPIADSFPFSPSDFCAADLEGFDGLSGELGGFRQGAALDGDHGNRGSCLRVACEAKAEVELTGARVVVADPDGHCGGARGLAPTAAADAAEGVGFTYALLLTPLPYISTHIVDTKLISHFLPNWPCSSALIQTDFNSA